LGDQGRAASRRGRSRDLKEGVVSLVRRDNGSKLTLSLDVVAETARTLLEEIQFDMFNAAKARLADNTHDVANVAEATEAAEDGFARLDWSQVGEAGEAQLKVNAITVRCLQRRDGSMPLNDTEDDSCASSPSRTELSKSSQLGRGGNDRRDVEGLTGSARRTLAVVHP